MKKEILLSIIWCFALSTSAQLFEMSNDPVFRKADGQMYTLALAGGLNQPQFSNIDFNNDGRQDLFVFDKTGSKTLAFVSQTVGNSIQYRYAPEYEGFFPKGSEFMRLADFDDDGKPDVWTYNGETLEIYKNNSTGVLSFSNLGSQVTQDNVSPDATGAYTKRRFTHIRGCQPAIVDLDGDEDLDFVTNLNLLGSKMMLIRSITADLGLPLSTLEFETVDKCFGGIDERGGEMITNADCLFFESYKKKHASSKTLLFFDNDEDGDLDLFYGSSEKEEYPIYFFHNDRVELGYYKDTFTSIDTNYFSQDIKSQMPIAPMMSYVDIDLDGELDLILSTNEGDKSSYPIHETQNVLMFINDEDTDNPIFNFKQNDFLGGDMIDFGGRTSPAFGDLDGDGDEDLIIATNGDHYITGDTSDRLVYFENVGNAADPVFRLMDMDYLGLSASNYRGLSPIFADLDGDNDLDLYLGKQEGTIAAYINSGTPTSPVFGLQTERFAEIETNGSAAPYFYDMNGDGTLDLLLGSLRGSIAYYENTGSANVPVFTLKKEELGGIVVNELIRSSKINPDGSLGDTLLPAFTAYSVPRVIHWSESSIGLAVGSQEGFVRLYEIPVDLNSTFAEVVDYMNQDFTFEPYTKDWGAHAVPGIADLDGDGISDILVGNSRGGVNYLKGNERLVNSLNPPKKPREEFVLAPNPATSSFTIYTKDNRPFVYEIHNLAGKVIATGESRRGAVIQLDQAISNGVYFVNVKSDTDFYSTQKLIISK